jgi:hypothetical protein
VICPRRQLAVFKKVPLHALLRFTLRGNRPRRRNVHALAVAILTTIFVLIPAQRSISFEVHQDLIKHFYDSG